MSSDKKPTFDVDEQLLRASESDDVSSAAEALKNGANVYYRQIGSTSAFVTALKSGNAEMVGLFLDHGADPNAKLSNAYEYQIYDIEPLMLAVLMGHEDVVKLLLERGAMSWHWHQFGKDDDGVGYTTPLGKAAEKGFKNIVKILRDHGAHDDDGYSDVDWQGGQTHTVKDWAKQHGQQEIASLLEEKQGVKETETQAETVQPASPAQDTNPPASDVSSANINQGDLTETDWLESDEGGPSSLISFLRERHLNDRKLFLAGCGWARRFWERLGRRSKTAIEIYERFADGEAPAGDYAAAWARYKEMFEKDGDYFAWMQDVEEAQSDFYTALIQARAAWLRALPYMESATSKEESEDAERQIVLPARGVFSVGRGAYIDASDEFCFASGQQAAEYQAQCDIIRDIFENPFRSVTLEDSWLSANDGAVSKLAQTIYDEHAFQRLPELADALEKSGCHDDQILSHCRSQGGHVHGCWVIDLLLAKDKIEFPLGARMPLLPPDMIYGS